MKLIIQIPCYNEEKSLPVTLAALPRQIEGFDTVEWLIINDGSTDKTVEIARKLGVDHIVNFKKNMGLAKVFIAGLEACVKKGADVIVNTDADNQYNAEDIPKLIKPITDSKADIVIGERPISKTRHFSFQKKILQRIGSWTVRLTSKTQIPDAPSGFRAISRDAAIKLNVFSEYTYTLETIIQAGHSGMAITSVPIRTNEDLRPSKLVKSIPKYIRHSINTMFRVFTVYKPFKIFMTLGITFFTAGFLLGVRWLFLFFVMHTERTHVPSLILTAIFIILGFLLIVLGAIADLISVNRKILEELQYKMRKLEVEKALEKGEDHKE